MPSKKASTGSKTSAGKKATAKRAAKSRGGRPLTVNVPIAGSVTGTPPAGAVAGAILPGVAIENERTNFRQLLALNPNHFGNLAGTQFQPVLPMQFNVKYEDLSCLGYNPDLRTLEATVKINQPVGYSGGPCSAGSTEYVRFYINYGGGWEDLGVAGFPVHDIPNTVDCARVPDKPLSYVVTKPFEPKPKTCGSPVTPKVRAILSWNQPPPPNSPNWTPPWGNVKERTIQIKPLFVFDWTVLGGLLTAVDTNIFVKVPELQALAKIPLPTALPDPPDPPPLGLGVLAKRYGVEAGKRAAPSVEPHRFASATIEQAISVAAASPQFALSQTAVFANAGLNFAEVFSAFTTTNNNVAFEQLDCVGLDYNNEWLVGTFTVKKSNGYSGSQCDGGSKEYVAFWADWDNTCQWTYVGTSEVRVYDIPNVPSDGLRYSAVIPASLDKFRKPCKTPKIARVRAVLSWNTPPSTTDPDALPRWGNRVDVHVRIRPGQPAPLDKPLINTIGSVFIEEIETTTTGLTKPNAKLGTLVEADGGLQQGCPFGGWINLTADVPPEFSQNNYKYKTAIQRINPTTGAPLAPPVYVLTPFSTMKNGVLTVREPDANGFFKYLDPNDNYYKTLAAWNSAAYGFPDDLWQVRLELYDQNEVFKAATDWYRVQLDNTAPKAEIDIDPAIGGNCNDFAKGTQVRGLFKATDKYFGSYVLDTRPFSMNPPPPTTDLGTSSGGKTVCFSPTGTQPGDNEWRLNTSNMTPCGYVVTLSVNDRSICDNGARNNTAADDVGFCLRKP